MRSGTRLFAVETLCISRKALNSQIEKRASVSLPLESRNEDAEKTSAMSCILHIETSTSVCSVAVSEDSQVIFEQQTLEGPSHAAVLAPFVDEALSFAESHAIPLDAVAV